ncbi:methionyl-tRNA formyltransferase [Candidatus Peregrinibacteria bacterium]|nr:methionyl-tRNA formyltransferase [Candidatus Peregrinibacteria bacterium]
MKKISLIFIGTAGIGIPLLGKLARDDRFDVKLVITQADRPAGRRMQLTPSPIKVESLMLGIESYQPDNINSEESAAKIREIRPDMIVLYAYGQILSKKLLDIPKYGCINAHASLLPKYRGASPVQQALLESDDVTGLSVMKMVKEMDAGPVYKQFDLDIKKEDDVLSLTDRLANLTAYEMPDLLYTIASGDIEPEPQADAQATYCEKIRKSDGEIDWNEDAKTIHAKMRAYAGWPGTFTFWNGKRLKILSGQADAYEVEPGKVIEKDHLIFIGTKKGSIVPDEVQMEGKTPQKMYAFVKGYPHFINSKLG